MKAVTIKTHGGPEVLEYGEVTTPEPSPGEARVRLAACGVNFIDTYQRSGAYSVNFPFTPGLEGAGEVDAVGENVTEISTGDHVAFAMHPGAYAEYACVPAWRLAPVNVTLVEPRIAAAAMLQGMTAHYLTHSTFPLREGHTALVHAAAGGAGLLLVQMAKMCGANVVGTAGSEEKARMAREAGADEVILYRERDFVEEVYRLTEGEGVDVAYDSVGKDTFDGSLDCLKPRGTIVLFGQASGPVPPVDLQTLNAKGSLFATRPSLGYYTADREELLWRAESLFAWIGQGNLSVHGGGSYLLSEAAQAHRDLESRKTTGKLLLIP
jgi:NADPH2:quinone reductase